MNKFYFYIAKGVFLIYFLEFPRQLIKGDSVYGDTFALAFSG
jgi:hypothetical protein